MNKAACTCAWMAAALAIGCVIEPGSAPPNGVVVSGPPPEPMQETRPVASGARAMWIPGYWHWTGMQYAWIPGHWEVAAPGARWRPPRYQLRDGTYYYVPGGWVSP